jgi:diketogulonate reductase-like aldo/keto reductase
MRAALKNGMNFWNGGEFYGTPERNSMTLLEAYFAKYPDDADKVVLSIKGALGPKGPDGSPEGIRRSIDNVLKQLNGRKKLDIFECARRDPNVPMEDTFRTMQEYIDKGLLGGISLSEVAPSTIHEAVKHAKIVAVEVELSLFSPDVLTNGVAAACAQYGIPLIAYSPIGRGVRLFAHLSLLDTPVTNLLSRDRSSAATSNPKPTSRPSSSISHASTPRTSPTTSSCSSTSTRSPRRRAAPRRSWPSPGRAASRAGPACPPSSPSRAPPTHRASTRTRWRST